jgi:hypothetical protein
MSAQLILAGLLAVVGAGVHGIAGELLVVRRLPSGELAATPFGGPRMTRAMIHVTWHLTTAAFLAVGVGLVLAGAVLDGDTARAVGLFAAGTATVFALVVVGLGFIDTRSPASLFRHPGPLVLTAIAALAWWGAV